VVVVVVVVAADADAVPLVLLPCVAVPPPDAAALVANMAHSLHARSVLWVAGAATNEPGGHVVASWHAAALGADE